MRLFHTTSHENAVSILTGGFIDRTGSFGFEGLALSGVWLSDIPVDGSEGGSGEATLAVDLDVPEQDLEAFEVKEEVPRPIREFVVPADFIRQNGQVRRATTEEVESALDERLAKSLEILGPAGNGRSSRDGES